MSIHNIKNGEIPLKAYLRADSCSQKFEIVDESGEISSLVTEEMFWGTKSNKGLYLDYHFIDNRKIQVTEGLSHTQNSQTMYNDDCDIWIQNNLLQSKESKLYVIQGYAGCGKTTFVNKMITERKIDKENFYIDIGKDWSYQNEPYMFFSELLQTFEALMQNITKEKSSRRTAWEYFIELGSKQYLKELDIQVYDIIAEFAEIKKNSNWNKLPYNLRRHLNVTLKGKSNNPSNKKLLHNCGQIETLTSIIILLCCAKSLTDMKMGVTQKDIKLVFDNLDVITDPAIPAENVVSLWGVIHRFNYFKNIYFIQEQEYLPNIGFYITVRKVLFSHITSHLPDLEMQIDYNPYYINVCDISELYLSKDILKNRIAYWKKHINNDVVLKKLERIDRVSLINLCQNEVNGDNDEQIANSINLDAFFNYNYRALSNVLSIFSENDKYASLFLYDFDNSSETKGWEKVSTIVFLLTLLYRKERVWNRMGFGCIDFDKRDYPTTLNRLILNHLYVAKYGQTLYDYSIDKNSIPESSVVSLRKLIEEFQNIKFLSINSKWNEKQINENYKLVSLNTKEIVIERLADMCARNTRAAHSIAYGYNSDDDELWRRPLYFIGGVTLNHTATSFKELKDYFLDLVNNNKSDQISFSITDEGFVLIHDFVANFEFYSARYCREDLQKPLHHAYTVREVDALIWPVYNAVLLCCKRHGFFMNQYMKNYKKNTDSYLCLFFHPRTNPHFDFTGDIKKISKNSFRPQLHIVRVIYNHINHFNRVKKLFYFSDIYEKNQMCRSLSKWIGKYLALYKNFFFDLLEHSAFQYDNVVYNDLHKLYRKQIDLYQKGFDDNVNIGNKPII